MYNKIIISDRFNTKKIDLRGNIKEEPISSEDFINDTTRELNGKVLDYSALHDFARTLKAIVKQEMLREMVGRLENIDVFY